MEFYQQGPELQNTFETDPLLSRWWKAPSRQRASAPVLEHLHRCGQKAAGSWLEASREAEASKPELVSYDPWGRRVDDIRVSPSWKFLESEAAREGIVATAYERQWGELSRPYQMSLLYLFHPSSAFVSCPLAMTDGAARVLELLGNSGLKARAFRNLTSRDPAIFWTSGQWMTERTGGSDVSGTTTHAVPTGSVFRLHGTKWFTSATTSQMSLLLARTDDSASLSLFYVELRDEHGRLNQIEVHRLKDKLGTRALPTAELSLKGTPGLRVGEAGQGVKNIATLLNITRIYNSVCATAQMRRGLDLLQSYSQARLAFGKKLKDLPLHAQTLRDLEATWRRAFVFTFRLAELLGKEECGTLSAREKIELRVMTPILKLWTAKESVRVASEVCEGFGGAGYIEDTGVPGLLRDAQVFSIWEGTTNVLALDFLRALRKESGAEDWFHAQCQEFLKLSGDLDVAFHQERLQHILKMAGKDSEQLEVHARDLALSVGFLFSHALESRGDST